MPPSEDHREATSATTGLSTWISLAWALLFALMYIKTVVQARAPGFWRDLSHASGLIP